MEYHADDKETLRVLKMQDEHLQRLSQQSSLQADELHSMSSRIERLKKMADDAAQKQGITLPEEHHYPIPNATPAYPSLDLSSVPSWEQLLEQAELQGITPDVTMEDLLTGDQIHYALSEVRRIHESFDTITGLQQRDIAFLAIATGIQLARWTFIPKIVSQLKRFSQQANGPALVVKAVLQQIKQTPEAQRFERAMQSDLFVSQAQQLATLGTLDHIGQQAAMPLIINMTITALHLMQYDATMDGPYEYYEARTRKVLTLSNLLASASNLTLALSTEQLQRIDLGGLLVTGVRSLQDLAFITHLKERFMTQHLDEAYAEQLQDIDNHFKNTNKTLQQQ